METLEHELMDECDAKEVAHDLPESVSIRDLKALLPSDFCDQVHLAVAQTGYLSEHQWHAGPVLHVRFIMGPDDSAQVQIGENVNRNALEVADELDESVRALLPAEHKAGIQVWHRRPVLDRWNEQWVFETVIAASDKVLEESTVETVQLAGLTEQGARAWQAIVNVLQQENALPNGEKIIYTPEEWKEREGECLGAELVVLHENGDHCPYFNLNFQGHLMHAKMDLALRNAGFRMESQANWYSAIYKAPMGDAVLEKLNEHESDEDFDDEDRDMFEPGGTREDRIRYLFQNAGLHIANMVEIPADPKWGDLGKPKRTIESVLQPDGSRPWTTTGDPKMPELLDFLRRMLSNLGEILETTDVDYTTRFNQELGAWEIKWFIGDQIERPGLRENNDEFEDEDFDDAKDVEPPMFQPGDIVRRPNSHWPEMTGTVTHRNGYVYGEPRNITWWVDWGKDPSLDGPVATADLELVERPEPLSLPENEHEDEDADDAKEVGLVPPTRAEMPSGQEGWQNYLQNVYGSFEEFASYDEMYGLANRLGFATAEEAWAVNPVVRGSTNPADYGVVESVDEFAGEDEDNVKDVWFNDPPAVNITHTFKLNFDFGAGEGTQQLVFTVPSELLPPVGVDGDLTEIKNYAAQYARQTLKDIPPDYWTWLVDVEPANPERLVSELGEDLNSEVVSAAQEADKEPSDEQKEAGNYSKGHVVIQGLDISIENAKGSLRRGKDKGGKEWEVKLPAHYGYIKGTEGKDKDHIDVFIGENPDSEKVFVVNQDKMEGGLDEHKVMLGFEDRDDAIQHYDDAYSDGLGKKLRGSVVSTTMDKFKAWLKDGDHKKEYEDVKLAESLIDEVFAYLKLIGPQMEQAKLAAAEQATDPQIRESILKGHGSYVGSCGHRIQGCRCPSEGHPGAIPVEAVCRECSKGNVQESVEVSRESIQKFLDEITASETYNEDEGFHHLPDGTQTGICTRTAELIAKKFGGRVVGYWHKDNPTAKLGESEGGHDFVVIGNRWLVDWWAKNVTGDTAQEIFDFQDANDVKLMTELYGESSKWVPMDVKESQQPIVGYHASPNKFKTFDTSKEGAHFGTREQASNIKKHGLRQPVAYSLDIKNPVRLHDIGVWNNFNNLHAALSVGDHIAQEQSDEVWAAWLRSDAEGWEALKAALEANGYDGIVYQSEQEGPGDSYIALRAGQIHRLKESGTELKLAESIIVDRKGVPFLETEEFDEPEFNEIEPQHEWEPRERPANNWAFYNKETEVGLNIRNDGGGNYYFSLGIPGSVYNVITSQYASDEEAVRAGLDWANRDPVFLSRSKR